MSISTWTRLAGLDAVDMGGRLRCGGVVNMYSLNGQNKNTTGSHVYKYDRFQCMIENVTNHHTHEQNKSRERNISCGHSFTIQFT